MAPFAQSAQKDETSQASGIPLSTPTPYQSPTGAARRESAPCGTVALCSGRRQTAMARQSQLTIRWLLVLLVSVAGLCVLPSGVTTGGPRIAAVVALDGAVGPGTAGYVVCSLSEAQRQDAAVVVLQVDTPGGLDSAMRDIIRAMLASPVPILAYVAPSGARAASAGTYIVYAAALAAMAPGTNLGAATP